jgi:hypothetical protein
MADISLPWGGDLTIDATGDFASVSGSDEVAQRIVRRFLTNPAMTDSAGNPVAPDYVFGADYGGAARHFVDRPITDQLLAQIKQRFIHEAQREPEVLADPAPIVTVTKTIDGNIAIQAQVFLAGGGVALIPQSGALVIGT